MNEHFDTTSLQPRHVVHMSRHAVYSVCVDTYIHYRRLSAVIPPTFYSRSLGSLMLQPARCFSLHRIHTSDLHVMSYRKVVLQDAQEQEVQHLYRPGYNVGLPGHLLYTYYPLQLGGSSHNNQNLAFQVIAYA